MYSLLALNLILLFLRKGTTDELIIPDMYVTDRVNKEKFLKLSYRDLRERTGIEISHWSDWFNRKADPKFGTLEKIASDLEMPLFEFLEAFVERRSRTIASKKSA